MFQRCARSQQRGFTLAELLVVISILGVLAGVVVYSVSGIGSRGQSEACAEDARTLQVAEASHRAKTGSYTTEAGLVAAGWLQTESSLHDISLSGSTYTIVDVSPCENTTSTTVANALPPGVSVSTGGPDGVTVELVSSGGTGLQGGLVDYAETAWEPMGYTRADGRVTQPLASGKYSFRIDFRGQTTDSGLVEVESGTIVTFRTAPVTLALVGNQSPSVPAEVAYRANNGYWVSVDATDESGISVAELLLGNYEPRVDFNGRTNVLESQNVTDATTIKVPLTTAIVISSGDGAIEHRSNNGAAWITDDPGSSKVAVVLLPGTYSFRTVGAKETTQVDDVAIDGSETIVTIK